MKIQDRQASPPPRATASAEPPPRHRATATAPPPSCGRDAQGFHWRNRRVARIYRTRVMTPPSPAPHAHAPSTEAADTAATAAAAAATAGTKATAAARVSTRVDSSPLATSHSFHSPHHGAELCFTGVVRGLEQGSPIHGICYTAYLPMAQGRLRALAEETAADHPQALIYIHHTLGEVAAGQASILLAVATPHSAEAFAVSQTLLRRLKLEVPIWKKPIEALDCP